MSYATNDIRNIALVGHAYSGKTTLAEALLHAAGAIGAVGTVEKGSTVSDFDPLEQKHQHSLRTALVSLDHNKSHINLIDTPGDPDLFGQTLNVLPAVETVAIVVDAATGIQTMTRRVMEQATARKQCRMVIINHIDADGVDLEGIFRSVQDGFGSECLAINLPASGGSEVVDCFFNPSGDSDFWSVEQAHTSSTRR